MPSLSQSPSEAVISMHRNGQLSEVYKEIAEEICPDSANSAEDGPLIVSLVQAAHNRIFLDDKTGVIPAIEGTSSHSAETIMDMIQERADDLVHELAEKSPQDRHTDAEHHIQYQAAQEFIARTQQALDL